MCFYYFLDQNLESSSFRSLLFLKTLDSGALLIFTVGTFKEGGLGQEYIDEMEDRMIGQESNKEFALELRMISNNLLICGIYKNWIHFTLVS